MKATKTIRATSDYSTELIKYWKSGRNRHEVFRRLFELHAPSVISFFRRRGFSAEDSEDLTQETFLGVLRGLSNFRSDSSFKSWIFSIATNASRNHIRSRKTVKRSGEEVPWNDLSGMAELFVLQQGPFFLPDGPDETPLGKLLAEERLQDLYDALYTLSPSEQRCLVLRVCQGLKYREIALVLQLPIGSVKSKLARARQHLKERLEHRYPEIEV